MSLRIPSCFAFSMLQVQLVQNWQLSSHLVTVTLLELEMAEKPHSCTFGKLSKTLLLCLCLTTPSWEVRFNFYNRDNVEWSEEQEATARSKVQENSSQLLPQDKQGTFRCYCDVYVLTCVRSSRRVWSELCLHLHLFIFSSTVFRIHYLAPSRGRMTEKESFCPKFTFLWLFHLLLRIVPQE